MRTINIDMDGVVYDMVGVLRERMRGVLGQDLPPPDSWDFGNWPLEEAGLTGTNMIQQQAYQGLFTWGYSVEGAIQGIRDLYDAGHDLRVVTNKKGLGPASLIAMTDALGWLKGQQILDMVDVVFVDNYDKQGYPADVVIDDNPTLDWMQEGRINILFDQPWNRHVGIPLTEDGLARWATVLRKDWAGIVELLT